MRPRPSTRTASPQGFGPHRASAAFSMIEVVISIAIVGALLVSVFNIVGVSAKRGIATTQRTKAVWIANELLAEIGAKPCESDEGNLLTDTLIDLTDVKVFATATQGRSRIAYDSVFDYNGWVSSPPVDADGQPLASFKGWARAVTVSPIDPVALSRRTVSDTAAVITVVAVGPGNARHSVSVVRSFAADQLRNAAPDGSGGVPDAVLRDLGS